MEYRSEVDIANRALQYCGAARIGADGFNEDSKNASECAFAYGKLREAELRRAPWKFAVKHCVMRPLVDGSRKLAPALWSSLTSYFVGSLVTDDQGNIWQSLAPANLNNAPRVSAAWVPYYGPLSVHPWDTTGETTYWRGELVYTYDGTGAVRVFVSLENSNQDDPETASGYVATATYKKEAVVVSASVNYQSLVDFNKGQTPASSPSAWTTTLTRPVTSGKWLEVSDTVALQEINTLQPIEYGPGLSHNIFMLPNGFLKTTRQDPKAGMISFLGAPSGLAPNDYIIEGAFLTSSRPDPFVFRFIANVTWVGDFDAMFCEGLAARIALSVCEILTQSGSKLQLIGAAYKEFMSEARINNAIDNGPVEDDVDEWIVLRS